MSLYKVDQNCGGTNIAATSLVFALTLFSRFSLTKMLPDSNRLILISLDAFGYNCLDKVPLNKLPTFKQFIENGVKAKWLYNVHPTVTWPNHMTIVTGLYPESHGIVHNSFYDPVFDEKFHFMNLSQSRVSKWYDTGEEPIWVTNKKKGSNHRSGGTFWPGSAAAIKGIGVDKEMLPWNEQENIGPLERVKKIIEWITDKSEPINLGLLYLEKLDTISHKFGPNSKEALECIIEEDKALGILLDALRNHSLLDTTNIIITGDHGQVDIQGYINLYELLNTSLFSAFPSGSGDTCVHIWPKKGKEEELLNALRNISHVQVNKKGESKFLKEFHYEKNQRIGPIVLETDAGWAIRTKPPDPSRNQSIGGHGWNPSLKEMRPLFLAIGPDFKKGIVSEPFESVNLYPLMCFLLGLDPAPNNGTLDNVRHLLANPPKSWTEKLEINTWQHLLIDVLVFVVAGGVFSMFTVALCRLSRRSTSKRNTYHLKNSSPQSSHLLGHDGTSDEEDDV